MIYSHHSVTVQCSRNGAVPQEVIEDHDGGTLVWCQRCFLVFDGIKPGRCPRAQKSGYCPAAASAGSAWHAGAGPSSL